MPSPWKVFKKWQAGLEATRGTAVAATRLLYVLDGELSKNQPTLNYPEDSGDFIQSYENDLGLIEAGGPIRDAKVTFEDLIFWLSLALKGGVTPSGIDPYTWAFVPSLATDDLKAATFEWADGPNDWEMPFGMVNSLTLRGTYNDIWKLSAELIGKDKVATTLTPSIARITREAALFRKTKLYVDPTTIGTTEVVNRMLEAEITINNNLARNYSGTQDGLFTDIIRGKRVISGRIRMKFTNKTYYDNWLAGTKQKVRLEISGSDSPSRRIRLDTYGRWQSHVLGEQEGMIYADMELIPMYDAGVTAEVAAEVVNHVSAL